MQKAVQFLQCKYKISFYFLTWRFHCEVICKEHLAGFDMRGVFVSFCFLFSLFSPFILFMILLFLTVFSGVSEPWKDKEAFQKAFPSSNPLSTNQILIYLGEVRIVKECLHRRQTPRQLFNDGILVSEWQIPYKQWILKKIKHERELWCLLPSNKTHVTWDVTSMYIL